MSPRSMSYLEKERKGENFNIYGLCMIMMQSTILTEHTDENFFKLKKILL